MSPSASQHPCPTLTIRRGTPRDAAALAELAERTFRATFGAQNSAADVDAYVAATYGEALQARELADPETITLLADVSGTLAGFAQLRRSVPPECVSGARAIELARFYVDAELHGRGVAQEMMRHTIAAARAAGATTLWLGVWEHNPRAQAFYRKHAFQDVGEHAFVLGADVQRDRVMRRTLDAAEHFHSTGDRI